MIIILNNLFILIGGLFLSFVNFFENDRKTGRTYDLEILKKLNLQADSEKSKKDETRLDKIRGVLLEYMLTKSAIGIILTVAVLLFLFGSLEFAGMFLTMIAMVYVFIFYYPTIKEQRSYSDLNQELPYALRHMGIELKSGKGLHDALAAIKNSDYGSLSKEFNRVLEEVKYGSSTEDSLLEMSNRVKSDGLSRAVQQIIGTLRVGGNLSETLNIIAGDITFDMHIKLKEYSQKLNSFILIYTFIAILTPVIGLIMLMAGSTVMGDVISSNLLLIIYTVFFPMIVTFMGMFVKKLEPKI